MAGKMVDEKFEKLRKAWYSDRNVQFEIIKNLMHRETVFLHTEKRLAHRCIKANAIHYLQSNWNRYHFFEEPFNLYASLAKMPSMPVFSFNRFTKKDEMKQFNEKAHEYMKGFDFMFDIDNEDVELAYTTASKIKADFDERKISYFILFSGKKGFHIRVDYEDFPDWIKKLNYYDTAKLFKEFAENYRNINGLPDIDLSIFDIRRIAKAPYSVVYPYYFIALPLSDSQFENFKLKEVSLPYWLNRTSELYKRGVLKRQGTNKAFGSMIKEFTNL